MKQIHLPNNEITIIDDEYYELVSQFKWHKSKAGYVSRNIWVNGKVKGEYLHRLIMKPSKGLVVDHINFDTLDNRCSNLRVCTQSDNNAHRKLRVDSSTGIPGVGWNKSRKKWTVRITYGKKTYFLGYYENIEDAKNARNSKIKDIHKEFAYLAENM